MEIIKFTKGVENAVLTQRDGNPIQYTGVWFSKSEIYSVSAATSAIYNCGLQLYENDLKYILIEGKKAKILIAPLKNYGSSTLNRIIEIQQLQGNNNEFFIAITTQPFINLGGIFIKTRKSLIEIKKALILSGQSFKPPLRHFTEEEINNIIKISDVKEEIQFHDRVSFYSMEIDRTMSVKLDQILEEFQRNTLDLMEAFIILDGGFIISSVESNEVKDSNSLDTKATMSYSLLVTANKCAWILKKMHVNSILLECANSFQFIHKVHDSIFSVKMAKGRQKLGLLRLIIPRYCKKIANVLLEKNKIDKQPVAVDFTSLFSELIM